MESLIIYCDKPAAEALKSSFATLPEVSYREVKTSYLDGSAGEWIIYVSATAQLVPPVLNLITEIVKAKNLKRIEFNEKKIEEPTVDDIENLKQENAKDSKAQDDMTQADMTQDGKGRDDKDKTVKDEQKKDA